MNKIKYINSSKKIDNLFIKKRKNNIEKIYSYLDNRNFNDYLKPIEITESQEIYPYIIEQDTTSKDKAIDLIYLTNLLHIKTTSFETKNIDKIKERYETTIDKLNEVFEYYNKMQDKIEEKIYMSPAEMLLINNISKVYLMLDHSRFYIEKYFQETNNITTERHVFNHGNLSLDHILESEEKKLISWSKAKKDLPVYDIVTLFKNDFDILELSSLYDVYQAKFKNTKEEEYLFLSLINIPDIIRLNKSNFINTLEVRRLINYIDKILDFTLEKNKEYQEANKEELEE